MSKLAVFTIFQILPALFDLKNAMIWTLKLVNNCQLLLKILPDSVFTEIITQLKVKHHLYSKKLDFVIFEDFLTRKTLFW